MLFSCSINRIIHDENVKLWRIIMTEGRFENFVYFYHLKYVWDAFNTHQCPLSSNFVHRKYRQWWKPTQKNVWNLTNTHTCTPFELILKKKIYWLLSRILGRFHYSETNSSDLCALPIHPDNIALCICICIYIHRKRSVFMHAYQFIRKIEKFNLLIGFLLRLTIFTWPTKIEYHQIKEPLAVAIMILGTCAPLCALCRMYTLQRSFNQSKCI